MEQLVALQVEGRTALLGYLYYSLGYLGRV